MNQDTRNKVASELIKIAKQLVAEEDLTEKQYELMTQAEKMGISFIFKEKYVKGLRAKGPRNWTKANIDQLQDAIDNNRTKVIIWRG